MATAKKAKKASVKKETPLDQVVGVLEKVAAEVVAPGSISVVREGGSTTIEYTEVAFSMRGDGTRVAEQIPVKVEV